MPIQFLNPANLPPDVTRIEREYLDLLTKESDDPSKQHSVIVRCWHEASGTYQPARFFEPTDQQLTLCLSELAPVLSKVQADPACICSERHQALTQAYDTLLAATVGYQLTNEAHYALKDRVSRDVWQRLKQLRKQVFYSPQDFSRAIVPLLQPLVDSPDALRDVGMIVMQAFQQVGIVEEMRQRRAHDLLVTLDEWHGAIPQKPFPPTSQPCPFCKLPYRYSLMDVLPYEQQAITRLTQAIVGAPVMLQDIPLVCAAIETWLFTDDDSLFAKKNPILQRTATFRLLTAMKTKIHALRSAWMSSNDSTGSPAPTSPNSASSSSDAAPPPPPPPIPDANSIISSSSGNSAT